MKHAPVEVLLANLVETTLGQYANRLRQGYGGPPKVHAKAEGGHYVSPLVSAFPRPLTGAHATPVGRTHDPDLDAHSSAGHTGGMNGTEKIAVSLPKGIADRARRAVRQGRAPSVSAYVAAALEELAKLDELSVLLDEMLSESGGPLSASERRAADRALGVSSKARRRK